MSDQTQTVQSHVVEKMNQELFAQLRKVPLLSSLKDDELYCVEGVQELRIEKDEVLVRQGEGAHFFWILLEGELSVNHALGDGTDLAVAKIEAGNTFGELPLLANIPNAANIFASQSSRLLQLDEEQFWSLMTSCPDVRKAILGNMTQRLQKMQSMTVQQEKMASLGTLAAGLMHELNNPGSAARRAASQLRENLTRMHELTLSWSEYELTREQKLCIYNLQKQALSAKKPLMMNSLEQSDAEETLAEWMDSAHVENAWRMAPTLASIGMDSEQLECVRQDFDGTMLSDALNWLEAMVSSMQLVGTIEESIGRVTDLVHAVKSYAYEGKGQRQTIDVNDSIHATMVILAHKMREKEITVEKNFAANLPPLHSECTGLNQIWTNLLDNAIDAVPQNGKISVRTWAEDSAADPAHPHKDICIRIADNGSGIPLESQAQIFDPFFTTKPVGVGTGIGLGIVQRIVDQYNGTIRFSSEPGDTEFVVRLPTEQE
ncbi:sensor histidine kinase [Granulicella sp. L60]|jgi:signal transduction histidine kinase|uniref:sensor histidine kinase n=1 Tax=Granulicella sp. L60 TaxID=1641866 RepID=UPI00131E5644|nr:ATP-binding protein [Granulicella sp. L60]